MPEKKLKRTKEEKRFEKNPRRYVTRVWGLLRREERIINRAHIQGERI